MLCLYVPDCIIVDDPEDVTFELYLPYNIYELEIYPPYSIYGLELYLPYNIHVYNL